MDRAKSIIVLLIKISIVLLLAWLGLYSPFNVITTGVDPSWQYGINAAGLHHLCFGSDLVFTYGPLGYLSVPLPIDGHIGYAIIAQIVITCAWSFIVIYACCNWLSLKRLIVFGALWLFVPPSLGMKMIVAVIGLCCFSLYEHQRWRLLFFIGIATFFATIAVFAKFSAGISAVGTVGTALLIHTFKDWKASRQIWAVVVGVGSITTLLITFSCFDSFGGFTRWVYGSLQLASGYSSSMVISGSVDEIKLALVCIVIFLTLLVMNYCSSCSCERYAVIVCFIPVFMSFKHGFVRQDAHVVGFFAGFLLVACTLLICVKSRTSFNRSACMACVAALFCVVVDGNYDHVPDYDRIMGRKSISAIKSMVNLDATIQEYLDKSFLCLEGERMDIGVVAAINRSMKTADVIPWDTSIIAANDFTWRPAPIFQHYAAYTAELDAINAAHYESEKAADVLLCRYQSIDGRHMLFDTPASWRSIFKHYSFDRFIPEKNLMVLRKSSIRPNNERVVDGPKICNANEWVIIPQTNRALYVKIPIRYTLAGKLVKTLFRFPFLHISVVFSDRSIQHWRLTPDTIKNGMLINFIPRSLEDIAGIMNGKASARAVAFQLFGPGAKFCSFPEDMQWFTEGAPIECTATDDDSIFFDAPGFHKHVGSLKTWNEDDGQEQQSALCAIESVDKAGLMAFGRYFLLLPGDYTATFRMRATGMQKASDVIATVDVVCDKGQAILVKKQITSEMLAPEGQWIDIEIPLTINRLPDDIECRVYYEGIGELAFQSLRVDRLGNE